MLLISSRALLAKAQFLIFTIMLKNATLWGEIWNEPTIFVSGRNKIIKFGSLLQLNHVHAKRGLSPGKSYPWIQVYPRQDEKDNKETKNEQNLPKDPGCLSLKGKIIVLFSVVMVFVSLKCRFTKQRCVCK